MRKKNKDSDDLQTCHYTEAIIIYCAKRTISELERLGEYGKPVSRQYWKVVCADSEETNSANNISFNVFCRNQYSEKLIIFEG